MSETIVLVINCGSSSLKFAVVEPRAGTMIQQGIADRLGSPQATLRVGSSERTALPAEDGPFEVLDRIAPYLEGVRISAVGHRVVHGGEAFSDTVVLDQRAIDEIRHCARLAPLHNPANLLGIEAALARFPNVPHVAVFDTAFHQSLPPKAFLYAIPHELYVEEKVRRYGFHGTSHRYVAGEAARLLGKPLDSLQLVTAHLGNGCSTCAVKHGRSVDTSMGFTPLEGLVMGTRSGDVDPSLHQFLSDRRGYTLAQVTDLFTRKSGLLGLSGVSNDMRTVLEAAAIDPRARLAVEVFCYRLAKSILGLCAALDRLDALIFTGGIGEHAAPVRAGTLAELRVLRPELDVECNQNHGKHSQGRITQPGSPLLALVVPSNEELVIARESARFIHTD